MVPYVCIACVTQPEIASPKHTRERWPNFKPAAELASEEEASKYFHFSESPRFKDLLLLIESS